jgi:6-pyruvoyltetrahydropterin/6-carboxytetrahydropterin synthase
VASGRYQISKRFEFSASHQLTGLPADHQCARLHGHNYIVEVVLEATSLDAVGFVRDYGELSSIKQYIDALLDHKHLNDVFTFNPTAENMAAFLCGYFQAEYPELVAIRLSETPKTWAEYRVA